MGTELRNPPAGGDKPVEVWITPTIERDFKARGIFPELRAETGLAIRCGAQHLHRLTVPEAEALLQDVEQQYESGDAQRRQRGLGVAYGSLRCALSEAVRHAKGLWDDPGLERLQKRQDAELARFEVGDYARHWCPWGESDLDGQRVLITKGYGVYGCIDDDEGEFVTPDGERVTYRCGYLGMRVGSDKERFYRPCELQTIDHKPSYLRLVVDNRPSASPDDLFKLRGPFGPGDGRPAS